MQNTIDPFSTEDTVLRMPRLLYEISEALEASSPYISVADYAQDLGASGAKATLD